MIEKDVLDYLNLSALSVPAYMEMPDDLVEFVLVQKIGGSKADQICTSTIQLTIYGGSMYRAALLCEQVVHLMDVMAETVDSVSRSHYGGSYNATFTSDKTYRYRATYEITHY